MKRLVLVSAALTIMLAVPVMAADSVDANSQVPATGAEWKNLTSTAAADAAGSGGGGAAADHWHFSLTPIAVWSFNVKGPVTLLGDTRYVNASAGDIRNNMSFAGGVGFEFGKGAWTGGFTIQKLEWELDNVTGALPNAHNFQFDYSVAQAGLTYRLPVAPGPKAPTVKLLGFIRSSEMKLIVRNTANNAFVGDKNITWTDPFIGMTVVQPIKGTFFGILSADIGGFGLSNNQSQLTWDFLAGFGYHWQFEAGWGLTLSGGYKAQQYILQAQDSNLTPDDFSMDQRMQGPSLALSVTW